ncbi:MFS transporter [Candidatus Peregrinibacteria bacterium]|nr:MFS transporter [Candidatus Peregrinibacteria bacterium]MBT4367194.1 MFS transporter [Candidatus Peregrinibacteria bacterium]MBT6730588.1 MFS transporter [Candidatus Peregrinibacteria bacterium]MBT7009474.1 MFS transporter [Candidatus Peregrinibacteria bacterium]MBT7345268.1 MFS transporter [Candidatus Peregrinibacteria bacterium]
MKNIHRLMLASFLFGLSFSLPIETLFFIEKGISLYELMILESILLISVIIFEIPTGIIGDKIGRKWSLVFSFVINIFAWIPWLLADSFFLFAITFFMFGIACAFYSGSDQALIYDDLKAVGKEGKMKKVYGMYDSMKVFSAGIAALIGGYIAHQHLLEEFYNLFFLCIVAQIIGLIVLLTVKEPSRSIKGMQKKHAPEKALVLFKDGIRLILSNKKLRKILLLSAFTMPFSYVLIRFYQPYFKLADVPNIWFGQALFLSCILSAFAKIFAYKIESIFGVDKGTLIITIVPSILWGLMAVVFHPALAIMIFILNDGAGCIRDPIFADYQNRHIESKNRATVLSTISLIISLYHLIMRPIIGYFADIDIRYSFIIMAVLILFGAIIFRIKEEDVKPNTL